MTRLLSMSAKASKGSESRPNRVIAWISYHGWTLLIGAAAFLAGMAVMLPMGWTLDGSAAELIGALVGAVATIGGAILLWQVQERHRSEHLAKAIALQFGSIFGACDELIQAIPDRDSQKLAQDARFALREIDECKQKIARFDQSLQLLPSRKIATFVIAETVVSTLRVNVERVNQIAPMISSHPTLANQVLDDAAASLRKHYADLGKELERFAPGWSDEDEE